MRHPRRVRGARRAARAGRDAHAFVVHLHPHARRALCPPAAPRRAARRPTPLPAPPRAPCRLRPRARRLHGARSAPRQAPRREAAGHTPTSGSAMPPLHARHPAPAPAPRGRRGADGPRTRQSPPWGRPAAAALLTRRRAPRRSGFHVLRDGKSTVLLRWRARGASREPPSSPTLPLPLPQGNRRGQRRACGAGEGQPRGGGAGGAARRAHGRTGARGTPRRRRGARALRAMRAASRRDGRGAGVGVGLAWEEGGGWASPRAQWRRAGAPTCDLWRARSVQARGAVPRAGPLWRSRGGVQGSDMSSPAPFKPSMHRASRRRRHATRARLIACACL